MITFHCTSPPPFPPPQLLAAHGAVLWRQTFFCYQGHYICPQGLNPMSFLPLLYEEHNTMCKYAFETQTTSYNFLSCMFIN